MVQNMNILIADITNKCNLRCNHCYYYREDYPKNELSNEEWIEIFEKEKPDLIVFLGGEPMLRFPLINFLSSYSKINIINTNGLFTLPMNNGFQFIISIDGTEKFHNAIRGEGTYEIIKRNIRKDCIIAMTITEQNKSCIKEFYNEWKDKVKGIRFNFYSPYSENDHQTVTNKNEIIEELKDIDTLNPYEELEAWKEENIEETRRQCVKKNGNIKRLSCMGNSKICNNKFCSANYCYLPKIIKVI